nr:PREDICTED: serine/threonine-protein phosphatase 1 regulatory subunit 10-like [Bemisia tabaci]
MPRICPEQLLNCLKVLLAPNGGIKSEEQIDRLVSLIQKFSTKLVSKCIYISILKATDVKLINSFMGAGGWKLLHTWLESSMAAENWPLTVELLELLQLVPVDLERLKSNTIPKLVKSLSKQQENTAARNIALDLLGKWAFIVKSAAASTPTNVLSQVKEETETTVPVKTEPIGVNAEIKNDVSLKIKSEVNSETCEVKVEPKIEPVVGASNTPASGAPPLPVPKLKISLKDVPKVSQLKKENEIYGNSDDSENEHSLCNGDADDSDENRKLSKRERLQKKYKDTQEDTQDRMRKQKLNRIGEKEHLSSSSSNSSISGGAKPVTSKVKSKDLKGKPDKTSDKKLDSLKDKKSKDLKLKDKALFQSEKDPPKSLKDKVQAEKDKANLAKALPAPASVVKLGKIPKKVSQGSDIKPSSFNLFDSNSSNHNSVKNKVLSDDRNKKVIPNEKSIPKKPVVVEPPKVVKKVSISIEPKRSLPEDIKLKTVKTFNSKFRLTGLEEEPPKPPAPKKSSSSNSATNSSSPATHSSSSTSSSSSPGSSDKKPGLKRTSPPKEQPPEKKIRTETPSPSSSPASNDKKKSKTEDQKEDKKPHAAAKKPMLLESVGFMDALDAANIKTEPRKRKRKLSTTKESNGGPEPKKEASPTGASGDSDSPKVPISPPIVKPQFKFYQDTMETSLEEDSKSKESSEVNPPEQVKPKDEFHADAQEDKSSSEEEFKVNITENEVPLGETRPEMPKSALVHFKSKKDGKRKSVSWREEDCLISVKYFELDETERINVTRNFTDMKQQERYAERENFLKARNLASEDIMEEKVAWMCPPPLIDLEPSTVIPGKNSQEKDIQYAREKNVLQAIYFNRRSIPDTPAEPDLEIHATTDPTLIPLEDTTGSTDSVCDFTHEPWPEPKREEFEMTMPNMMMPNNNFMYPGMNNSFPCGPFPPANMFPGGPNPMGPGDWRGPDPNMPMFPGGRPGPMGPGPGPMGPMVPGGPPGPMGPVGPMGPMGPMGPGPGPDMGFPGNFDPSFGPGMGPPGGGPPNMFNGPGPGPGWFDPSGNNMGPQGMMNMNSDFGPSGNMPPRNSGKYRNDDRGGRGDSRPWKGKDKSKNKGKGSFKKGDYNEEFALKHGICKMFLRKGNCSFANCKFLHSLPP